MSETVTITDPITVNDLASKLNIEVTDLMTELFKNGIMVTLNDLVDFDTAEIIVSELKEVDVKLERMESTSDQNNKSKDREIVKAGERPPVIAVMGHVDHGKTTLLDTIRGENVVGSEAGGITQHISAYQIEHNSRKITFLDTPGHEAFSALRQHGAALTDLAIIVVAADDGVKPQTKEAIRFAQQAGVKMMVALNKIDKPEANVNRVMQELSDAGLNPEQWGGDTVVVEVSAAKKTGIDKLLDMALLITDVEELKADTEGPAQGIVIEGHMEKGRGAVVSLLVEHGLLKVGDYISAGRSYGKIRTLEGQGSDKIREAGPSTPVTVTGLKVLPDFGAAFYTHKTEKIARTAAESYSENQSSLRVASSGSELLAQIHKDRVAQSLPVIVKADVKGSVRSVVESLQVLGDKEINVNIISSGVGNITENDVSAAAAGGGIVYGFSVEVPNNVKRAAAQQAVEIKIFNVIYELIDDVKQRLEELLNPEIVETNVGRLVVKAVFKTTQSDVICGGEVTKGKIKAGLLARIFRDKEQIAEAEVTQVQKGQETVKEAIQSDMCGLSLKTDKKVHLKEGDKLELFEIEQVKRKIGAK